MQDALVTILACFLMAFGVLDLVRWSPEWTSGRRSGLALAAGGAAAAVVAGLCGVGLATGAALTGAVLVAGVLWSFADAPSVRHPEAVALGSLGGAVVIAILASPLSPEVSGPLATWYASLAFQGLQDVPTSQAVLTVAAMTALQATGNRLVRLVLSAAGTPARSAETKLRGGRLLGPMERTFIFALALSGDLTAAAVVIAAKGILRLPEIRSVNEERQGQPDLVTEYFLIGTFASWLVAITCAGLVSASG